VGFRAGRRTAGSFGVRWVRGTTVTATDCGWMGVLRRRVFLDGLVLTATTCDHGGRGNEFSGVPVATWGVCGVDQPARVAHGHFDPKSDTSTIRPV
jgi:hypothetical protein